MAVGLQSLEDNSMGHGTYLRPFLRFFLLIKGILLRLPRRVYNPARKPPGTGFFSRSRNWAGAGSRRVFGETRFKILKFKKIYKKLEKNDKKLHFLMSSLV